MENRINKGLKKQKVLLIYTEIDGLRSAIIGYDSVEDPRLSNREKPIRPAKTDSYGCVLEAMNDGWRLLGPPQYNGICNPEDADLQNYTWWLYQDVYDE
jgi:hypothetical protein